jgi:hypothetical protein
MLSAPHGASKMLAGIIGATFEAAYAILLTIGTKKG